MIYVGLTDDPIRRRSEHGDPIDWQQAGPFASENAARAWEKEQLSLPGRQGGPGGSGWRFGYWYSITPYTRQ